MDLGGRATQDAKAEAWTTYMDVGSFPKRPDREGMPIRAYRDIFTRLIRETRLRQPCCENCSCNLSRRVFELNSILYSEFVSELPSQNKSK